MYIYIHARRACIYVSVCLSVCLSVYLCVRVRMKGSDHGIHAHMPLRVAVHQLISEWHPCCPSARCGEQELPVAPVGSLHPLSGCFGRPAYMFQPSIERGRKEHVHVRIPHVGSKAQDQGGDSRNHDFQDPLVYVPCIIYTIYHIL